MTELEMSSRAVVAYERISRLESELAEACHERDIAVSNLVDAVGFERTVRVLHLNANSVRAIMRRRHDLLHGG